MRAIGIGIGMLTVVAVAACAAPRGTGAPVPGPSGTADLRAAWVSCAAAGADPQNETPDPLPRLGTDFQPIAVTVCRKEARQRPGGGTDSVAVEERSESIAALVDALRLPDEPSVTHVCLAYLQLPPWLALHDAQGRWFRPGTPVDGCHHIRPEVTNALRDLRVTEVSSRTLGEITSSEAAAAGCDQQWADMIWAMSVDAPPSDRTLKPIQPPAPDAQVRLCVYRVPAAEQRSGKPAGDFERGGVLRHDRWAAIRQALPAPAVAEPCTTPASRFAVLHATNTGEIYAELDGCRRIMQDRVGGGTPALVVALEAALG